MEQLANGITKESQHVSGILSIILMLPLQDSHQKFPKYSATVTAQCIAVLHKYHEPFWLTWKNRWQLVSILAKHKWADSWSPLQRHIFLSQAFILLITQREPILHKTKANLKRSNHFMLLWNLKVTLSWLSSWHFHETSWTLARHGLKPFTERQWLWTVKPTTQFARERHPLNDTCYSYSPLLFGDSSIYSLH